MHFQTINYILYPGKFQRVISGSEDHFLPVMMGHSDHKMIMQIYDHVTNPFAVIAEDQYTKMYQLFRKVLRREQAFNFKELDFIELNRHMRALIAGLLGIGLHGKVKKQEKRIN